MATYTEIKTMCKEYNIKPSQIANYTIKNSGKFEGESLATVYFYQGMLDGWTDESDCIALSEKDKRLFGIDSKYSYIHIWEDSNGFCYSEYLTEDTYYSANFNSENDEDYFDEYGLESVGADTEESDEDNESEICTHCQKTYNKCSCNVA